jgi:hypothetical protein
MERIYHDAFFMLTAAFEHRMSYANDSQQGPREELAVRYPKDSASTLNGEMRDVTGRSLHGNGERTDFWANRRKNAGRAGRL